MNDSTYTDALVLKVDDGGTYKNALNDRRKNCPKWKSCSFVIKKIKYTSYICTKSG